MIIRGARATIALTLLDGDSPVDADDPPTLTITRDSDGSTVADAVEMVSEGDGLYTHELAAGDVPEVELLHFEMNATVDGDDGFSQKGQVEVVGSWIVPLSEITAKLPAGVSSANAATARVWAETSIEDACGVAFRPRYARDRLVSDGGRDIMLTRTRCQRVLAASQQGTAISDDALGVLDLSSSGLLTGTGRWLCGRVEVAYVHGYELAPDRVRQAVIKLARFFMIDRPSDLNDRATSISTDDGTTYSLVTPGVGGAEFSIPEVNQVVDQYQRLQVGVG